MKSLILIISFFTLINFAYAGNKDIDNYINTQIDSMVVAMNQMDNGNSNDKADRWFLDLFRVHFIGSVGIEVPWIAKLIVKPTVEFHFKRALPQGHVLYSPVK